MQVFILAFVLFYSHLVQCTDLNVRWTDFCGDQQDTHIFCFDTTGSCEGKDLNVIEVTVEERDIIIKEINSFRSDVAYQNLETFNRITTEKPQVAAMNEMKWDPFLEQMAIFRAQRCEYSFLYDPLDVKLEKRHTRTGLVFEDKWEDWSYVIPFAWKFEYNFYFHPGTNEQGGKTFEQFKQWSDESFENNDVLRNYTDEMFYSSIQSYKDDNYLIGCARSTFKEGEDTVLLFACFTGPRNSTGDYINTEYGEPGASCVPQNEADGLCKTSDDDQFPDVYTLEKKLFSTVSTIEAISTDSFTPNEINDNSSFESTGASTNSDSSSISRNKLVIIRLLTLLLVYIL